MEIILSVAFGLWICITAFAYRAFTGDRKEWEKDR